LPTDTKTSFDLYDLSLILEDNILNRISLHLTKYPQTPYSKPKQHLYESLINFYNAPELNPKTIKYSLRSLLQQILSPTCSIKHTATNHFSFLEDPCKMTEMEIETQSNTPAIPEVSNSDPPPPPSPSSKKKKSWTNDTCVTALAPKASADHPGCQRTRRQLPYV